MEKSYKFLVNLMIYVVALIAVIYAVITGLTVPFWAVLLFTIGIVAASVLVDRPKKIRIKYFVPGMGYIQSISVGDWIDLRAGEDVTLKKDDYYLIRLGVGMILPEGYEALIVPRSSTPAAFGIMSANSVGVIDNSYCGDGDEWRFPVIAIRDTVIRKGDRIAQFRILANQPKIEFEAVSRLKSRNRGGVGSTGTR